MFKLLFNPVSDMSKFNLTITKLGSCRHKQQWSSTKTIPEGKIKWQIISDQILNSFSCNQGTEVAMKVLETTFHWPPKTPLLLFLGIATLFGSSIVLLANETTCSESCRTPVPGNGIVTAVSGLEVNNQYTALLGMQKLVWTACCMPTILCGNDCNQIVTFDSFENRKYYP